MPANCGTEAGRCSSQGNELCRSEIGRYRENSEESFWELPCLDRWQDRIPEDPESEEL